MLKEESELVNSSVKHFLGILQTSMSLPMPRFTCLLNVLLIFSILQDPSPEEEE
jgi:hypothetical protein